MEFLYEKFLAHLNRHMVEYGIAGGYAVAYCGWIRVTEDLDIVISARLENRETFCRALNEMNFIPGDHFIANDFEDSLGAVRHLSRKEWIQLKKYSLREKDRLDVAELSRLESQNR